ncbi:hypothetical protein V1264_016300 [Littorina saxatilis]|uniref:C-type lectin domain-containing protein n=1 Tax=Littorina saxatilis TaxID=31220 RepID=A0AAN9BNY4_9CAEN
MGYLFVVSLALLLHGVLSGCPNGWTQFQNSCYEYMSSAHKWTDAQTSCKSLDQHGKLVEIGSADENNFVANFVKSHGGQNVWVGINDMAKEGHFVFGTSTWGLPYTNWNPGEPNNNAGSEDCVAIDVQRYNGHWHDQNCDNQLSFVCEVVGQVTGGHTAAPNTGSHQNYPFRDTSLSWDKRVDDLVSRLTLEEIQGQMSRGGAGRPAPAIPRLGIEEYQFWTGCNRGDVWAPGNATSFPQAIGIAAAFDPDLRFRVAEATSIEVRAKHIVFQRTGQHGTHTGLSCFSPNLDIMKHPFWGRNQETHGECPYMARVFADKFIKGLHGDHPRYARATAGCKHFAVHSGPEKAHGPHGHDRRSFDSKASMEDMRMTYLPGFRQCVESGTYSFMSSYNAINGVPVPANKWLLTDLLRNEWNFTGYVLADSGAIENMVYSFHYTKNAVDTVAACVNAGLNIETSGNLDNPMFMSMVDAIHQGKLTEKLVRERVKPLFYTRMRLGEFDPPHLNPYMNLDLSSIESPKHRQLSLETAMKSYVLLKNNGVLPLRKRYNNVALVGPFSTEINNLMGDYASNTPWSFKTSVMDAVKHVASNVHHGDGCDDVKCKNYNSQQVISQLNNVDLIFVAIGTGQTQEEEGVDKFDYNLPGHQKQLLNDVLDHAHNTPVIVVLFTGSALDISFADADHRVSAILECFFPSQAAGTALGHVFANDVAGAVPAGRLPFTWYKSENDIGDINDYSMAGKTYRYLNKEPLYPFGYGLSYTSFHYSQLSAPTTVQAGKDLKGSVHVQNTGSFDADEAVQVYMSWEEQGVPAPKVQLAWFDRLTIPKGGSKTVTFTVEAKTMALWVNNGWKISQGRMKLYAGGQQPNQKRSVGSNVLSHDFAVQGGITFQLFR